MKNGRNASNYKGGNRAVNGNGCVLGMDGYKDETRLQNKALLVAALAGGARHESSASGVLKDLADTAASSSRALQVLVCADLLSNSLSVRRGNRLLVGCPQGLDGVGIVSQISLAADQDDGKA